MTAKADDTAERKKMPITPADVMERVFTTQNPTTGSLPPPRIAWAVFANGTVFFTTPTETLPADSTLATIEKAAKEALRELGPVIAGTEKGDFNSSRLDGWFPDEPVWLIGFSSNTIGSVVVLETNEPTTAGFAGRKQREMDLGELKVVTIRGFDGVIERR